MRLSTFAMLLLAAPLGLGQILIPSEEEGDNNELMMVDGDTTFPSDTEFPTGTLFPTNENASAWVNLTFTLSMAPSDAEEEEGDKMEDESAATVVPGAPLVGGPPPPTFGTPTFGTPPSNTTTGLPPPIFGTPTVGTPPDSSGSTGGDSSGGDSSGGDSSGGDSSGGDSSGGEDGGDSSGGVSPGEPTAGPEDGESDTEAPVAFCSLCSDDSEVAFEGKLFRLENDELMSCNGLELELVLSTDPSCGGYDGTVGGMTDARSYCGCPFSNKPAVCPELCLNGQPMVNPDEVVNGMACWEWDELAQFTITPEACSTKFVEIEAICCPVTSPPTTATTKVEEGLEAPTPFPTNFPTTAMPVAAAPTIPTTFPTTVVPLPTTMPTPLPTPIPTTPPTPSPTEFPSTLPPIDIPETADVAGDGLFTRRFLRRVG